MQLRKKLAVLTAVALPLTGIAVFGGVTAANAGGGPLLTCAQVGANPSGPGAAMSFSEGGSPAGVYLNSGAGVTAALAANAFNGNTSITIGRNLLTVGQTLTVAGFTGTYTVANQSATEASLALGGTTNVVGVTPNLTGNLGKGGETKAKGVVTVNPTDGTNDTTAFDGNLTENFSLEASSCTSSASVPGEFSPTEAFVTASVPVSNSAIGLTAGAGALTGSSGATITFPAIGDGWSQPVTTTGSWNVAKADKVELGVGDGFGVVYGDGAITGDFATSKAGTLNLGVSDIVVCTEGELEAIAGTGPDTAHISTGANPLAVCDSGTASYYAPATDGSGNPTQAGLHEILSAETGGSSVNGGDGTPIAAIYGIQVAGLIGSQVL